jgi:hypothetical protein
MAAPLQVINIPPAGSVEQLRQSLQVILNRMNVATSDTKLVSDLNANNNSIKLLADPVNALDAVNLRTLRASLKKVMNSTVTRVTMNSGGGSETLSQTTISTTPYSVTSGDDVLTCVTGASVINLPDLSTRERRPLWILNTSASAVSLVPFSGDTVAGLTPFSLLAGASYQLIPNA